MTGKVVSVNISKRKGVQKESVAEVELRVGHGVVGDAHAGPGDRQVSLLALESIEAQKRLFEQKQREADSTTCPKGGDLLHPGAFAENITIQGLPLAQLPVGTRLHVGGAVVLEISRIGKDCHRYCAIYRKLGDCVMPREGVFARVMQGGTARPGDEVRVDTNRDRDGQ